MSEPFVGEIRLFAGTFVPLGWAACDGQTMAISDNDPLFSLIGTTYGGDGQETFALPDLRGRAAVGYGQGPGLESYAMGESGGVEAVTLTVGQIPAHGIPTSSGAATRHRPTATSSLAAGGSYAPLVQRGHRAGAGRCEPAAREHAAVRGRAVHHLALRDLPLPGVTAVDVRLRPATEADRAFVDELLRADATDLLVGVDEPLRTELVDQQVQARHAGYQAMWPTAVEWVVVADDVDVGRVLLAPTDDGQHIVDVRLLDRARGRGIGTALVSRLGQQADAAGEALSLSVAVDNPARRLYERAGFQSSPGSSPNGIDVRLVRPPEPGSAG